MKVPSKIVFADEKLEKAFKALKEGKTEDGQLFGFLERAFADIEEDAFCGVRIPKRMIPKEYRQSTA